MLTYNSLIVNLSNEFPLKDLPKGVSNYWIPNNINSPLKPKVILKYIESKRQQSFSFTMGKDTIVNIITYIRNADINKKEWFKS